MYEIRDGRYYFILIDFDMAVHLGDAESSGSYTATSKNRTGTLPFMAAELVRDAARALSQGKDWVPIRHRLRHDYESLFHISFWCTTALEESDSPNPLQWAAYAKEMEVGGLKQLGEHKNEMCANGLADMDVQPTERMRPLIPWFLEWALFFHQSVHPAWKEYKARVWSAKYNTKLPQPPPFDEETVDGRFTRDTLKAALTPAIPEESWYRETHPLPEDLDDVVAPASAGDSAGDSSSKTAKPSKQAKSKQSKQAEGSVRTPKEPKAKKDSKPDLPDEHLPKAVIEYRSRLRSSKK